MLVHISEKIIQIFIKNLRDHNKIKKHTTFIFSHEEDYIDSFNNFIKCIESDLKYSLPKSYLSNINIIINSNSNNAIKLFYNLLNIHFIKSQDISIEFGKKKSKPINLSAYPNIKTVRCKGKSITNFLNLPPNLLEIRLAKNHNPLNSLSGIKVNSLYTHYSYNKPILWSDSEIKSISFGREYNQENLGILPKNTTQLSFSYGFNGNLDNLPSYIQKIKIDGNFNKPIDLLPNSLDTLIIKSLNFSYPLYNLPSNITTLKLDFNKSYPYDLSCLPDSIVHLELNDWVLDNINKLPNLLETLTILDVKYELSLEKKINLIKKNIKYKLPKLYFISKGKINEIKYT